jgi:hypothetical protein
MKRSAEPASGSDVPVFHLPRVVHDVVANATDEELDRPAPPRDLALGVVGPDGVEGRLAMGGAAVGGEHDLALGPDLDLAGELLRLVDVDVAEDLVAGPATAARPWAKLGGDPGSDVVEVGLTGTQQIEPPIQVLR